MAACSVSVATETAAEDGSPSAQPFQSVASTIATPKLSAPLTEPSSVLGPVMTDTQSRNAEHATCTEERSKSTSIPTVYTGALPNFAAFDTLRLWAESYEDAQSARISCENRMLRGNVQPEDFALQLDAIKIGEMVCKKAMKGAYRKAAPKGVIAWQKGATGVGEHLLARLLGVVGHPVIATPYHWEGEGSQRELIADLPFERTVSQLWSYCGTGDAARKRAKGMSANDAMALGSPRAKMLVHLIAEGCIKAGVRKIEGVEGSPSTATRTAISEYGKVYLERRDKTAGREDWTDGHRHNDALRIVGKRVLRDLWVACHGEGL